MSTKDQYEVLEALGTGSFGTVSRIRRKADGRTLVWKEINFGTMSEKEKTQLVSEVNILRELRNPFVVRYHDRIVEKSRTRLYIIMEYCAGGDLSKIIKKSKINRNYVEENFIWKILAQILVALKDCHRRNNENGEYKPILHRDLKPANILLDNDQNVKIADFGLAKELSSQSKLAQTNVGTPFYMAPEIINERDYDEKSDIWSLGCLLYELAALRPPFDATNAVTLAQKINTGKFMRIPSKYSDALHDAIRSMLQIDPRKRPRVEDLENLPGLQPALTQARAILNDFKLQQNYSSKIRELKSREEAIQAREEKLNQLEASLKEREQLLLTREQSLKRDIENFQTMKATYATVPNPRRLSYDRVTEQMVIDDDEHQPFADADLYPHPDFPITLMAKQNAINDINNNTNAPASVAVQAKPLSFEIHCDFPDTNVSDKCNAFRGPIPVPVSNTVSMDSANVLPPAPPAPSMAARHIPRKPAHLPIATGAEHAKENINPLKFNANIVTKVSTSAISGKENDPKAMHRRNIPSDFLADPSVESSPLKKARVPISSGDNGKPIVRAGINKSGGPVNSLPQTVQIDLDTLLRPRYHR